MLEAKDQGYNFASGLKKKKEGHRARTAHFLRNFRRSSKKKKGVMELETEVKAKFSLVIFLFHESKNSAVLKRGQGIFEDL